MYIIQRLGRDAAWHEMPDEHYQLARVARYRAYELSFEHPDRCYRVKSPIGEVLVTFGPEGVELPPEAL